MVQLCRGGGSGGSASLLRLRKLTRGAEAPFIRYMLGWRSIKYAFTKDEERKGTLYQQKKTVPALCLLCPSFNTLTYTAVTITSLP